MATSAFFAPRAFSRCSNVPTVLATPTTWIFNTPAIFATAELTRPFLAKFVKDFKHFFICCYCDINSGYKT